MTRKEALDKLSSIERVEGNWIIGYYLTPTEELINQIYNDHEAQLKAKDEEIKGLRCRAYHAEGYISDLHNNY